jgi:hypothetical protein
MQPCVRGEVLVVVGEVAVEVDAAGAVLVPSLVVVVVEPLGQQLPDGDLAL